MPDSDPLQPDQEKPEIMPGLEYGLDRLPPPGRTVLYGLQWLIIFLPILTVLTVLVANVLNLTAEDTISYFQRLLIITGGTMIVQTLWGHRLPLLDGPAAALVITAAALASGGLPVISGGMIFGGFLIFLLGALGLTKYIAPLFTDRVVGVILLLIGLTILPYLIPMIIGKGPAHPLGSPLILALSLGLLVIMVMMSHFLHGLWQSLAIFWGVVLGSLVFAGLGMMDFSPVREAPFFSRPNPFWGPWPKFDFGAMISFVLAYFAVLVNASGSVFSIAPLVGAQNMDRRMKRAVAVTGISGIISGVLGVVGSVPYSISPGMVTVTRVGSRFPVTMCGVMMLSLGFLGKITAILSAVPSAVVGAALLTSMAAGLGVSIEIIRRPGPMKGRDYMVVGLPVLLGTASAMMPKAFLEQLPTSLEPIVGNGLIVGVVAVILLEHLILPDRKSVGK
jgi:xanthine/uracil permease